MDWLQDTVRAHFLKSRREQGVSFGTLKIIFRNVDIILNASVDLCQIMYIGDSYFLDEGGV
jgi:hypothetical protein